MHPEREAVLDGKHFNAGITHAVEAGEEFGDFLLESEVPAGGFGPGPIFAAELDFNDDTRCIIEIRITVADHEVFDPAEIDPLHQFDQMLAGGRYAALSGIVTNAATVCAEKRSGYGHDELLCIFGRYNSGRDAPSVHNGSTQSVLTSHD